MHVVVTLLKWVSHCGKQATAGDASSGFFFLNVPPISNGEVRDDHAS